MIQRIGDEIGGKIDGEMGEGIGERYAERRNDRIGVGTDEKVSDDGSEKIDGGEGLEGGDIRCLCARRVESGNRVCCDVCGGWSHLSCIGVKAGVSVLEGKYFVCFFCLSTCLLALRKEVGGLREELDVMHSKLTETREENEKLRSLVVQKRSEKLGVSQEV